MKTPKSYSDNLKNNIITDDMLGACIYSVNKRAKNFRDRTRKLYSEIDTKRSTYGQTGVEYQLKNIATAKATKVYYYRYKDQLLSIVNPISIHIVSGRNSSENRRYYLFYRVGSYSFHYPIDVKDLDKYPDLPQEDIGTLTTSGHEIEDLISVQFVDKVLHLIRTGRYIFQPSY